MNRPEYGAGKDSPLRNATSDLVRNVSSTIHNAFPKLTPNEISVLGITLVCFGDYLIQNQNRKNERNNMVVSLSVLLQALGYACDALDGGVAREKKRKTPQWHSKIDGATLDPALDRVREIYTASSRRETARHRGSKIGMLSANATLLTTSLPTVAREWTMALTGQSVQEVGSNPLAFMGSMPGRLLLNSLGTLYPRAQPIADAFQAVANVYSGYNRITRRSSAIDAQSRRIAREKARKLTPITGLATAATLVHFKHKKG
jgi:hypothetical protein